VGVGAGVGVSEFTSEPDEFPPPPHAPIESVKQASASMRSRNSRSGTAWTCGSVA
jgi:hypothetical protein